MLIVSIVNNKITLLILTVVTVLAHDMNFGDYGLLVAMIIASIKSSYVFAYFMHLKQEKTSLRRAIVWTCVFLICYLTTLMLIEGDYKQDMLAPYISWTYNK